MKTGEIWQSRKTGSKVKIIEVKYDNYKVIYFESDGRKITKDMKDYIVTFEFIDNDESEDNGIVLQCPRSFFVTEYEKVSGD